MTPVYCASCASPLKRGTSQRCPEDCGASLCRNPRRGCLTRHHPHNCPRWQKTRGLETA